MLSRKPRLKSANLSVSSSPSTSWPSRTFPTPPTATGHRELSVGRRSTWLRKRRCQLCNENAYSGLNILFVHHYTDNVLYLYKATLTMQYGYTLCIHYYTDYAIVERWICIYNTDYAIQKCIAEVLMIMMRMMMIMMMTIIIIIIWQSSAMTTHSPTKCWKHTRMVYIGISIVFGLVNITNQRYFAKHNVDLIHANNIMYYHYTEFLKCQTLAKL